MVGMSADATLGPAVHVYATASNGIYFNGITLQQLDGTSATLY